MYVFFMSATAFLLLFAFLFILQVVIEFGLDFLNLRHLHAHSVERPKYAKDLLSEETYRKSIAYTQAKTHFGMVSRLFNAIIVWFLILSGGFTWLDSWLHVAVSPDDQVLRLAYPMAIGLLLYALHLPFSVYGQFSLEERFGFNKSTAKTFVLDQIKGLALACLLGIPLLLAFYWFLDHTGSLWWIFAFFAYTVFQLVVAALFPVFLAPVFYKFTPLVDSTLSEKILDIANRVNFKMAGVFTIDGSRRSSHSNAFFAGLGKTRRVVLFDTLLENLTEDEIVAVVAHEMGHDKLKHIQKGLISSTLLSFFGFYVLYLAVKWPQFYLAFNAPPKPYIGFVLFVLFAGVFTYAIQPLFQWISRKNEYEADAFSVDVRSEKEHLKNALKKLAKDNLSNLTPHPWYSFFHYSHPTLLERLSFIDRR